jgi:hypothetical protein
VSAFLTAGALAKVVRRTRGIQQPNRDVRPGDNNTSVDAPRFVNGNVYQVVERSVRADPIDAERRNGAATMAMFVCARSLLEQSCRILFSEIRSAIA